MISTSLKFDNLFCLFTSEPSHGPSECSRISGTVIRDLRSSHYKTRSCCSVKMVTHQLQNGSCFSCDDSTLSTTASFLSILTFFYAILVGLLFYFFSAMKRALESPEQINATIISLETSVREVKDTYLTFFESPGQPRSCDRSAEEILHRAKVQLEDLQQMVTHMEPEIHSYSLGTRW